MAKQSKPVQNRYFIPLSMQDGVELPRLDALNKPGLKLFRELTSQQLVLQQDLPGSVRGPLATHHSSQFRSFAATYVLVRESDRRLDELDASAARHLWDAAIRFQATMAFRSDSK